MAHKTETAQYQPDFADHRIQKRVQSALGFVQGCIGTSTGREWSTRYIDKYLGQQQHPLSKWLRQQLLITTNSHWNSQTQKCKQYQVDQTGWSYVSDCLRNRRYVTRQYWHSHQQKGVNQDLTDPVEYLSTQHTPYTVTSDDASLVHAWAEVNHGSELASLVFEYQDKSSRLWHPLQSLKKSYKRQIFASAGLRHQYDIAAAAPTLLHQWSWRIPEILSDRPGRRIWLQGPMDLWLGTLRDFIPNRKQRRQELADRIGIPVTTAKVIITALFCGARLSHNSQSSMFQILGGQRHQIDLLKQDPWLTLLRQDIADMWDYINRTIPRRINPETQRRLPVSSRQKWYLYFDLERSVLNSVSAYLRERGIRHFLEHDGWSTEIALDINELTQHIQTTTGYQLQIDYENNY